MALKTPKDTHAYFNNLFDQAAREAFTKEDLTIILTHLCEQAKMQHMKGVSTPVITLVFERLLGRPAVQQEAPPPSAPAVLSAEDADRVLAAHGFIRGKEPIHGR